MSEQEPTKDLHIPRPPAFYLGADTRKGAAVMTVDFSNCPHNHEMTPGMTDFLNVFMQIQRGDPQMGVQFILVPLCDADPACTEAFAKVDNQFHHLRHLIQLTQDTVMAVYVKYLEAKGSGELAAKVWQYYGLDQRYQDWQILLTALGTVLNCDSEEHPFTLPAWIANQGEPTAPDPLTYEDFDQDDVS